MDMANDNIQNENEEDSIITDRDKIIQLKKMENEYPEQDDSIDRNITPQFKHIRFETDPNERRLNSDEESEQPSIRPDYISSDGEDEYSQGRNKPNNYQNRIKVLSRNINK